jgi:hypothetical protein
MRQFLAVLVVATLGGGIAAVVVRKASPETKIVHTEPTQPPVVVTNIVPAPGQSLVSGKVAAFTSDDAVAEPIRTPFTINAVERGARSHATIEGALIGGSRKTVYWDAGTPLPISGGGGALDLGPAHVDVSPTGVTWTLAGAARAFTPGKYHVGSPIAIGSGGLATSHDEGTDFTADDHTVLTTTPGVVLHLDSPTLLLDGPGSLQMTGQFTVRNSGGQRAATSIVFGPGPFRIAFNPAPGGLTVTATLQGPAKVT